VTVCEICQGAVRVTAAILDTEIIGRILKALGLPTEAPKLRPASCAPPSDETPEWVDLPESEFAL
jgi:hypothetical protein